MDIFPTHSAARRKDSVLMYRIDVLALGMEMHGALFLTKSNHNMMGR